MSRVYPKHALCETMVFAHKKQRKIGEKILWRILILATLATVAEGGTADFTTFDFTVEPSDSVVVKDSPALLNCGAKGEPIPKIDWKKEGAVLQFIEDSRRSLLPNGSLYFSNVHHSRTERPDEGVYQCMATIDNLGTIVSRSAKIQVASLLRFEEEPQDVTVYPGQTAYFPCTIQGIPLPEITWFKDEQPLALDLTRMIVLPSGALEIDIVQTSDAGIYKCNASNVDKFRVSSGGRLTVSLNYGEANKIASPRFIATPKDIIATEGDNITLDCAANGNPRPRITWLKNGVTIDLALLDSRFRTVGVGNLHIENIEEEDKGTYMCRAENHADSEDASANVEVQVPPRFIKRPQNKYAYEKEDVEFDCKIYGKPEPTVQWIKNGDVIIQSEYFQIVNGYNLRILGLVRSDMGLYQCIGTNPAGNVQASAQLIILNPESPRPTTHGSVTVFHSNNSGDLPKNKDRPSAPRQLSAVIISTRFITLSWKEPVKTNGAIFAYSVYYKDGSSKRERVINTTRPRLEEVSIQGLQPSTNYIVRVVTYNQHGPGESSEEITVQTHPEVHVPSPALNLQASPDSPTSIFIQWNPPDKHSGPVQNYKLYYMEVGTSEEHVVTTSDTNYLLQSLKKFTEYSFWVVAINQNGPGVSTEEVTSRTYSDIPDDTPQNVTVEAASSTSIIVRWQPPPKEAQNGIITGYKIRYKLKGSRRGDTVTTDGNRRLYALTGLKRGARYNIKIAALSVNGSGPSTDWLTTETFENDLNELVVPDHPKSLRARPQANSIFVSWTPPQNQNIMIRGYTIGWGIGFPDVYTKVLDGKQRYYTIENLHPSSEYVISLKAFNQVGDGRPVYETVRTLIESTPEPLTPMLPPVGLKAIVLSSSTVVLYWTDSTLPRNQLITDSRFYTVRYVPYPYSGHLRYRLYNSTDLNCMIDNLKPNTQYEFSVKVVLSPQESTWSMSVFNTTQEAAPATPPRDMTVVPLDDDSSVISLHWQPPKQPNGVITGYVIFYTTDNTQKDTDWVVEGVVGDKMTTTLRGLTADATYYFKIQARNKKGYGPLSSEVVFQTPPNGNRLTNSMLYIIIACVSSITLLVITIVSVFVCRRRHGYLTPLRNKSAKTAIKGMGVNKDLKPPDLWIHHDQMELKSLDKEHSAETTMTVTPIPRNSQELNNDSMISTLERKKGPLYTDLSHQDESKANDNSSLPRRTVRAKPIMIPVDSQQSPLRESTATVSPIPNGNINQHYDSGMSSMTRPVYPRTQYNIARANVNPSLSGSPELVSPSGQMSSVLYERIPSTPPLVSGTPFVTGTGQHATYTNPHHSNMSGNTALSKRPIEHPLKSFSVPAPPPQSVPTVPQPKHIGVRAQGIASPYRKAASSGSTSTPNVIDSSFSQSSTVSNTTTAANLPDHSSKSAGGDEVMSSCSTEDLNQEMTNLEGLMKDLNAITASDFEC
ncbi:neogenin-like isoform X2 [Limulus polyphemus]|uniref:Neogenin-like isoform X2 n=1 Tax=Limulus polyphemus TaxID=6850 RepID=A0ABM1SBM2_LIMPO|nr:neogenin-like isoform X2 [Limulus polyphemus]